ncbi:outer membrane lipid asymmetry maintenance protein MlaD [Sulfitobacter sabulilitoris]|uniref:Outer membrane lipid asymmetry maintenance protein MlaD n=1 Tax=Sulfitobacter sabulilitoris TaxID=2562655 RepID=A0A5S3PKK7_9RHOB|nr:outer membrane lipid asymmetry maintenance protein MlaD [Sulfitobacter sabulilitoris]TMM54080.1 outer membrane lipid asymmetry maintenance protein MlaD [Sulfitobacter sabulilitoris]
MSENSTEVIVGGAVLAGAIAFMLYAGQATGYATGSATYPLTASFRSIEGITVGSDVRLAGVKVGTVTDIELNIETYRASTTVAVQQDIAIPDDSAITVASEGLLGGNFIEIVPGGSPFFFEPGATIEDTQGAVSLISLLLKFVTGSGDSGAGE